MCVMCVQRPEDGVASSQAGVIGSVVLSSVGAGNRTQVLWKSSQYF